MKPPSKSNVRVNSYPGHYILTPANGFTPELGCAAVSIPGQYGTPSLNRMKKHLTQLFYQLGRRGADPDEITTTSNQIKLIDLALTEIKWPGRKNQC